VFLYDEDLTGLMILGIVLIMAGIIYCNLKPTEKKE
jgi:multidrug transporter EmrE-like cation transporter